MKQGGDWERRNRLKVYTGFHHLGLRKFEEASTLFLETLANFNSEEIFSYSQNVFYATIAGMLCLSRVDLKKKIVDSPEVKSVAADQTLGRFITSFYEGNYDVFFQALASVSDQMKLDAATAPHVGFYSREMRIRSAYLHVAYYLTFRAYQQYLTSYRSVTLESMAAAFGVSPEFIDSYCCHPCFPSLIWRSELSRFVAQGRLSCKIDAVSGIVETTRPDTKNGQYLATLKLGDTLMSRIQKLSRVTHL